MYTMSIPDTEKPRAMARGFSVYFVSRTGLEPARDNSHYPLKVARLPLPPPGHTRMRVRLLCTKVTIPAMH